MGESTAGDKVYAGFGDLSQPGLGHIAAALGLGSVPGLERHIREYRNGRDLMAAPRDVLVIDLFGLSAEGYLPCVSARK